MLEKIKELHKGELHVHLNGLFDSEVIKSIIKEEEVEIPINFDVDKHLNHFEPKINLVDYLKPWDILRLIPQNIENLTRLIESGFKKLKEDNVKFVELRSTVIYLSNILNLNLQTTLESLIEILNINSSRSGIDYGLILTISRSEFSSNHLSQLMKTYVDIGKPSKIIGLDLAGNEDYAISSSIPLMFRKAKDNFGLRITIHCGETGNVDNIIDAIENYNTDRIGHGTSILKSNKAVDLVVKKDICIEVCPISNYLTNYNINIDNKHPSIFFAENNIPFVICSDNPSIHNKPLSEDYHFLYEQGLSFETIKKMFENQKKYTFL